MKRASRRALVGILAAMIAAAATWCVSAQGFPMSLSGLFEMTVTTTQTDGIVVNPVIVNTTLAVGEYTATVDVKLTDTAFDSLRVGAAGPLGPLALNSSVSFNPSTLSFNSWQTGLTFAIYELSFSDVFYVTTPPTSSYNQLSVSGTLGDVSFQASSKFGICPLAYWESSLCADWPWEDCDTNLSACLQISDAAGVHSFDLTMTDYTLFESLLGTRWGIDIALTYTPDEKILSPTLKFQPDWFFCAEFEVLGEISAGPTLASVSGIDIYGLRGECAFTECLSLYIGESLDPSKNGSVTGKADYFEVIGISGCFPSCCGSDGSFDIATYFGDTSDALFDLELITGSVAIPLGSRIDITMEVEFPVDGDWKLVTEWSYVW